MHILIVNFQLEGISLEQYLEQAESLAPIWADVPGLISKTWLRNDETRTYGGVYVFESLDAVDAYKASDLYASMGANPNLVNITVTDFGVIESASRITRGMATVVA
jgi:heme-degrading monooxygenase HmoA